MPFIEQLLYGPSHLADAGERQELAHSAGMGADVSTEVRALCDAWGQAPELGLQHPALISHPLKSTMPSMRGRLYTVICVASGETPLFHAVVTNDVTYSGYNHNPYALDQAVDFCSEWDGRQGMDRLEVEPKPQNNLVAPPAGTGDVGLVDEAVLQFMLSGSLQLPLEQAVRQSDRAMALIIACLPEKDRKELKFASFTTARGNAYDVAGLETSGATFAGWQRLMMARVDAGVTTQQQEYKELIAGYLGRNDMTGVARVSNRHNFQEPAKSRIVVAAPQGLEKPGPAAAPAAPIAGGGTRAPRPTFSGPNPQPAAAAPRVTSPGVTSPRVTSPRGPLPEHGLDPAASGPRAAGASQSSWNRSRVGVPVVPGRRGADGRILRLVSVLLLVFLAGWVGTMWLDGRTLSESLEWAGLPGMDGRTGEVDHTGTLLEIVDVSRVYDRARKHTGGEGFGLSASGDKGREMALGRLQSDATDPLLEQVALFVQLSAEGIRPSRRPDREVQRLDTLAKQGAVLARELARLELAWYSFTTATNWMDLGILSDAAVTARRDSLDRAEKGALADVTLGMGTRHIRRDLAAAQGHLEGMIVLVRLFQAKQWSPEWETNLARAAENVPPSAGRTTRAYRNSAFALIRLKRAEHSAVNLNLPFARRYEAGQWPSPRVKAMLPLLRREAGRFADQSAPELLAATLSLYSSLESPEATIGSILESPRQWQRLQDNTAVLFDPNLYGNFLERLRYEAAGRRLVEGSDSAGVPGHLYRSNECGSVAAFAGSLGSLTQVEQWQALAANAADPFLRRWADHLAVDLQARLAHLQREFDAAWAECRVQAVGLQGQAKAGYDWTSDWLELHTTATEAIERYAAIRGEDPEQRARLEYLDKLVRSLTEQRPLKIARATVRLDQEVLPGPTEVQLELRTPVRGGVWLSKPFKIGPSAPAGTGWVGTTSLDWSVPLSPRHRITGRVVTAADHQELLVVSYPSLVESVGPAVLVRPRRGDLGSLSFRVELEEYWGGLEIPTLGPVF